MEKLNVVRSLNIKNSNFFAFFSFITFDQIDDGNIFTQKIYKEKSA